MFLLDNPEFKQGQIQVKTLILKGIRRYTDGMENFIFDASDKSNNNNIDKEFKEFLSNNSQFIRGIKPKIK